MASNANACDSDSDCAVGSRCIAGSNGAGGECTPESGQCFDEKECGDAEQCADGVCVLSCSSNADCRDGFTCDLSTGLCLGISQPCVVSNDCGNPSEVCVSGACVPRAVGGSCANAGDVWDENGCIPNEGAVFACQNDCVQDRCASGNICLHGGCWLSCDAPNQNICNSDPVNDVCKPVVDNGTTYNVCGTSANLGSQCGPGSSSDLVCSAGSICVDGFCK